MNIKEAVQAMKHGKKIIIQGNNNFYLYIDDDGHIKQKGYRLYVETYDVPYIVGVDQIDERGYKIGDSDTIYNIDKHIELDDNYIVYDNDHVIEEDECECL